MRLQYTSTTSLCTFKLVTLIMRFTNSCKSMRNSKSKTTRSWSSIVTPTKWLWCWLSQCWTLTSCPLFCTTLATWSCSRPTSTHFKLDALWISIRFRLANLCPIKTYSRRDNRWISSWNCSTPKLNWNKSSSICRQLVILPCHRTTIRKEKEWGPLMQHCQNSWLVTTRDSNRC